MGARRQLSLNTASSHFAGVPFLWNLFFGAILLLPCLAYGADPDPALSAKASFIPAVPPAAAAAGFRTLALNTDFSQPQPPGWFGCLGSGPGHTWYQGIQAGDFGTPVPCSTSGGTSRFNLVTDPSINEQVLDLTFLPGDIDFNRHYTTIQTVDDSTLPPVHGIVFPSSYYMEATYRVQSVPAVPREEIGGTWWGFWQAGEGVNPPGGRWNTLEIDHPEQHGEWPQLLGWAVLNWYTRSDGGYFPYSDVDDALDSTAYHTFGVRSTTDGTSMALCSYVDGMQRDCSSFSLNSALYAERKFPILSVGLQCYFFPSKSSECINIPISSIYNCSAGNFCVHTASKVTEQNHWPIWMNISGVTNASNINGSWRATPIFWSKGATDWVLTGSKFNGAPTGGMINHMTEIHLLIQNVRVWSCDIWDTRTCYTEVLTVTSSTLTHRLREIENMVRGLLRSIGFRFPLLRGR